MNTHLRSIFTLANVSHILSCLSLIFFVLVPFIGTWEFGYDGLTFYLKQGRGYVAENILIFISLCSVGTILGTFLWKITQRLHPTNLLLICTPPFLIALIAQLGLSENISRTAFYLSGGIFLLTVLSLFIIRKSTFPKALKWHNLQRWCTKKFSVNLVFFAVIFTSLLLNNLLQLASSNMDVGHYISIFIGRFFLFAAITGLLAFLVEILLLCTPKGFKWLIWGTLGLLPCLVVIDTFSTSIGRPLYPFINEFGEITIANFRMNLGACSENMKIFLYSQSDWLILLEGVSVLVSVFILSALIANLCQKASKKWNKQFSLFNITILFFAGISLAIAEQGLGTLWKSQQQRQEEYKNLPFQLGFFAAQRGVGTYNVTFKKTTSIEGEFLESPKLPDIYFFMVESMRADALTPKVTPFLAKFRDHSCQQLTSTWAGSNGTHLSWFSTFHSTPPVFWRSTVQQQENDPKNAGSPTLKWLKNQGYNLEVRAVCDLEYNQFGKTNFGSQGQLSHLIEHCSKDSLYASKGGICEREVFAFSQLRSALVKNKEGGNFYYTALDSPHYNYYWHSDFAPPFEDYVDDTSFPINPSPAELQRYVNRYWNACAWVDHQIEEFIGYLKANGRYENSIIVITGDHGEEFKEHGKWFHCSSVYNEQIEVPILIKWPKSQTLQPKVKNASHLDIMPSIMAHIGASDATLNILQGENLLSNSGDHTVITTTNYAGTNGVTMVMHRGDYAAYFSWPQYWLGNTPDQFSLESILKNGEPINLGDPTANLEALQKFFPDAFERFISEISVAE